MHIVTPLPPSPEPEAAVHVIVAQRPFAAFATPLLTVIDHTGLGPSQPLQVAVTTLEQIYLDHLLLGLGIEDRCLRADGDRVCRAWHAGHELTIDLPLAGSNGLSIIMELTSRQRPEDAALTAPVLLQLHHHLFRANPGPGATSELPLQKETTPRESPVSVENLVEAPGQWITIDFTTVWQQFEKFDIAFLFQDGYGWVFGGYLASSFDAHVSSYGAELRGGLLAIQLAIDLLKILELIQSQPPEVALLHDNIAVGHQLIGEWNAVADVHAAALLRHLVVYCEYRFAIRISAWYVAAHTGDPGNELADAIANRIIDRTSRPLAADVALGFSGPTRQNIIFRQFREAQVCIFALQETRLQRMCRSLQDYMIFHGAATPQGHFGVLLAISTSIPYGQTIDSQGQRHDLFFHRDHISVVVAQPRFLILRIVTPWVKFLAISGHAPHSGHSCDVIATWWDELAKALPSALNFWPRLLFVDANAKVGAEPCSQIGDFEGEDGGDKAEPFTHFVRTQGLWLPSTFDCHRGPSGTWRHHTGHWTRNDYVGLPVQWAIQQCDSWIAEEIDTSLHREDHRATLVRFSMDVSMENDLGPRRLPPPCEAVADLSSLRWTPEIPFSLDVHSHAQLLQTQVVACLPRRKHPGQVRLKHHMSDATWELVLQKRDWRKTLFDLDSLQKETMLSAYFSFWRAARDPPSGLSSLIGHYDHTLRDQDRLLAEALHQFRSCGRLVSRASRADDVAFFHSVLSEGSAFLQPAQSKDLWKTIKKALPKYQQRRQNVDPLRLLHLEDQWNPHFEALADSVWPVTFRLACFIGPHCATALMGRATYAF
eukprot:s3048_g13.t1